jgi:Xaa-Pro aminopeptidase
MIIVPAAALPFNFGTRAYLKFEYVTKVPMCKRLISVELLSAGEREWIDQYHKDVNETMMKLLAHSKEEDDKHVIRWLQDSTTPL